MIANPFVVNAQQVTDRKPVIRIAHPDPHTPGRLAAVAQDLTRRGYARARAEILSEALCAYTALCYEEDTCPGTCNVDAVDGRLLLPAPWGSKGHRLWGLRRTEADVLRAVLLTWAEPAHGEPLPLFMYSPVTRSWYLNVDDYPTHEVASTFLHHRSVTARLFKRYLQRVQAERGKGAE